MNDLPELRFCMFGFGSVNGTYRCLASSTVRLPAAHELSKDPLFPQSPPELVPSLRSVASTSPRFPPPPTSASQIESPATIYGGKGRKERKGGPSDSAANRSKVVRSRSYVARVPGS